MTTALFSSEGNGCLEQEVTTETAGQTVSCESFSPDPQLRITWSYPLRSPAEILMKPLQAGQHV